MATAPAVTDEIKGRILDCDAHLYMEPADMADMVGDVGAGFVLEFLNKYAGSDEDKAARARSRRGSRTVCCVACAISRR